MTVFQAFWDSLRLRRSVEPSAAVLEVLMMASAMSSRSSATRRTFSQADAFGHLEIVSERAGARIGGRFTQPFPAHWSGA